MLELRGWRRTLSLLAICASALAWAAPAAQAGTANGGLPGVGTDPIAGMTWGIPQDDDVWAAYVKTSGAKRALLGKLALEPRAVWLGWWWRINQVRAETALTVAETQSENPNALTEFATFELHPWEQKRKGTGAWYNTPGATWNVKSDETWYRNMAAGIGNARALVIVQVDLPFARTIPSTAPERIDTYAARVLSAGRHTTVYIDGGTAGWLTPRNAALLLIRNGIRYARGFALNDTDYDPTSTEDVFGAEVVTALAQLGVKNKHFIVDTDENGTPYKPDQVPGRNINLVPPCHGSRQAVCQRTGIPPTAKPASPLWNLGPTAREDAARYCDGYVWSGRPWDIDAGPYDSQDAMWLAGNGEY
jgi:hypothetical protein